MTDAEIDAAIDAMLHGRTVYAALLLYADFIGGPGRWWSGPYELHTLDGAVWKGAGNLISLDNVSPANGTIAANATVTLSGVDEDVVAQAVDDIDDIVERDCVAYVQFFGDGAVAGRYQCLGLPIAIGGWVSDQPTFTRSRDGKRTISLSLESYFVGRSRSPASFYSDTEQRDRAKAMGYAPDDDGGGYMTLLQNKTIHFPDL